MKKTLLLLLLGVMSSMSVLAEKYCEIDVKNMNGCDKQVWKSLTFVDCTKGEMTVTAWSDMLLAKKGSLMTLSLDTVRFTVDSVLLGKTRLERVGGIYTATIPDADSEVLQIFASNNTTYNPCITCDDPSLVKITDAQGNVVKISDEPLVDNFVAPGTYYIDSSNPDYTLNYAVVTSATTFQNYSLPDSIKLVNNDKLEIVANYTHRQPSLSIGNGYGSSEAFDGLMKQFDYILDGEKGSTDDITDLPDKVDAGYEMTLTLDEEKFQVDSVLYEDDGKETARKIEGINGVYTTSATDGHVASWYIYPKLKPRGTNKVVFVATPKDLDTSNLINYISVPGNKKMFWWPEDSIVTLNGYYMDFKLMGHAYRIDSVMINGEKADGYNYSYQTTITAENTPTIVNIAAKPYPKAILHTNNTNAITAKSAASGELYLLTANSILYISDFESDTISIKPVGKMKIEVRLNGNMVAADTSKVYNVVIHEGDSISVIYTPSLLKKMNGTYTDYSSELPNYKSEEYGMVEGAEFDIDVWDNDSIIIHNWMNEEDYNLHVKFNGDSIESYRDNAGNASPNFVYARSNMMVQIDTEKGYSWVNPDAVFLTLYHDMSHHGDTCYYHLTLSDVPTAVKAVAAEGQNGKTYQSGQRYTLQGLRAKEGYKGIVIENGKVYIK